MNDILRRSIFIRFNMKIHLETKLSPKMKFHHNDLLLIYISLLYPESMEWDHPTVDLHHPTCQVDTNSRITSLHHSFESYACVYRQFPAIENCKDLTKDKNYFRYHRVGHDGSVDDVQRSPLSNAVIVDDSNGDIFHYRIGDFHTWIFLEINFFSDQSSLSLTMDNKKYDNYISLGYVWERDPNCQHRIETARWLSMSSNVQHVEAFPGRN